jgi:hypothetical protein
MGGDPAPSPHTPRPAVSHAVTVKRRCLPQIEVVEEHQTQAPGRTTAQVLALPLSFPSSRSAPGGGGGGRAPAPPKGEAAAPAGVEAAAAEAEPAEPVVAGAR